MGTPPAVRVARGGSVAMVRGTALRRLRVVVLVLAFGVAGCGGEESTATERTSPTPSARPAATPTSTPAPTPTPLAAAAYRERVTAGVSTLNERLTRATSLAGAVAAGDAAAHAPFSEAVAQIRESTAPLRDLAAPACLQAAQLILRQAMNTYDNAASSLRGFLALAQRGDPDAGPFLDQAKARIGAGNALRDAALEMAEKATC